MLGRAKDATFELMDSVMTTRNVSCLAELSLSPLFRRKWSSTYEALEDSRPNRNKLMKRYVEEISTIFSIHTARENIYFSGVAGSRYDLGEMRSR